MTHLEVAKEAIRQTEGTHPTEHVSAWALIAIANALVSIADSMEVARKVRE